MTRGSGVCRVQHRKEAMTPHDVITEAIWGQNTESKGDSAAVALRVTDFLWRQGWTITKRDEGWTR